jgi:hypothetical protein
MRVPGRETGLIPGERIILGKNREISGSPLGISLPKIYPSNEKPCYKTYQVTGGQNTRGDEAIKIPSRVMRIGIVLVVRPG